MSTRTRVVLLYKGSVFRTGSYAVLELITRANPKVRNFKTLLSRVHLEGSKKEKLLAIACTLPPDFTLVLIQEPRGTRRNHSLYWQLKQPLKEE